MGPTKLLTATVENISTVTSATGMTNSVITSIQNHDQNFTLVNDVSQVIAVVTNIIPITAPIRIQTNTFAAATVFLKIEVDVEEGQEINPGDVVTLVGNLSGVVAAVAVLILAPEVALVATAIAVAADIAGLLIAAEQESMAEFVNDFTSQYFSNTPLPDMQGLYLTSDNQLMTPAEIQAAGKSYGGLVVKPDGSPPQLVPVQPLGELPASDQAGAGDPDGGDDWGDDGDDSDDDDGDDDQMTTQS